MFYRGIFESFHLTPFKLVDLARLIMISSTLSTFALNSTTDLFPTGRYQSIDPYMEFIPLTEKGIFRLFDFAYLPYVKLGITVFLVLALLGMFPAIATALYSYVCFSFVTSSPVVNGGDQIATIVSLLMIPVYITDSRIFIINSNFDYYPRRLNKYQLVITYYFLLLVKIQACTIYFFAAIDKFKVEEWVDGTALYYWFNHPMFGASGVVKSISNIIFKSEILATLLTWSVLFLEVALAMSLLSSFKFRRTVFKFGLLFHLGIFVVHGLFSFFLVMTSLLILYLLTELHSYALQKQD